jgi:hypothetical protein
MREGNTPEVLSMPGLEAEPIAMKTKDLFSEE